MFFRQIYDEKLAEAAYLIGCQKTGEAIVIDAERDIDRYEKIAAENGLRIVAAADTHIHADYLTGMREFAEKGARIYASDEGDADWKYLWLEKYDAVRLRHNDTFKVGNIRFRAIHTPGHTPEHLCYEVTDLGGGADEPMGVATGDFVFVGDLGRPDLLESAASDSARSRTICSCGRATARVRRAARRWARCRRARWGTRSSPTGAWPPRTKTSSCRWCSTDNRNRRATSRR